MVVNKKQVTINFDNAGRVLLEIHDVSMVELIAGFGSLVHAILDNSGPVPKAHMVNLLTEIVQSGGITGEKATIGIHFKQ
jgi:hypothetical protein